jgi:hypothetical protein
MRTWLRRLCHKKSPQKRHRADRRVRLELEALEERQLLSAYPITDMTQWAQQFPAPTHAQNLWINFDGKHNDGQTISAFVAQPGQDRDAGIQDILYRVAETFSPFDVQVRRLTGDGNYPTTNGDTTIFVGGDVAHLIKKGSLYYKITGGFTPANYADYANTYRGLDHAPNSDPYDLGFVDPMWWGGSPSADPAQWTNVEDDAQITQDIAHEAGHTFGLVHVLSSTTPDTMNYGSAGFQYFINQTLPVTTLNYNPATGVTAPTPSLQPLSHLDMNLGYTTIELPVSIQTQNSFTYLQTILGKRYSDGYIHFSDSSTVDPSSTNKPASSNWFIGPGPSVHGALGRTGDFDVYKIYAPYAKQFHIDVTPDRSTYLYPDVMVKDGSGNIVVFSHAGSTSTDAQVSFQATAGQVYTVVVGSEDTHGSGGFTIGVTANDPVPVLTGAAFTFTATGSPNFVLGRLLIQSEDVNNGTFQGVYTDTLGITIPVSGQLTGTATTSGVTTSGFSFSGATLGFVQSFVQYSGTLTGNGNPTPAGWADTLSGTMFEQDLHYVPGRGTIPIWTWGGLAPGKDF